MSNESFLTQSVRILKILTNEIKISLQTLNKDYEISNEDVSPNISYQIFKRIVLMRFFDLIPALATEVGFVTLYHRYTQTNQEDQERTIYQDMIIPCWNANSKTRIIPPQFFFGKMAQESQQIESLIFRVKLSNKVLEEILQFFQRFDWILSPQITPPQKITESNFVDPTILGMLCERNVAQSETGSFYTPSILAEYMVNSTIDTYITEKINTHFHINLNSMKTLLGNPQTKNPEDHTYFDYIIDQIWPSLTICDNSCGAGQFLISTTIVLHKILNQIITISSWEIIISHLFGVDIQHDSVETTRYRLFLQCFSDFKTDNMNISEIWYKISTQIKQGNAVIGYAHIPKPKTLLTQDFDAVMNLIHLKERLDFQLQSSLNTEIQQKLDKLLIADIRTFYASNKKAKDAQPMVHTLLSNSAQIQPFHWIIEFPEILRKGGFDMIIGNPPYLSFSSSKVQKDHAQKLLLDVFYSQLDDLYEAFVQKAKQLCKGLICFIIPTSFYKQIGARITQNLRLYENLGENVFKGVNASFCIIQFDNQLHSSFTFRSYLFQDQKLESLGQGNTQQVTNFNFFLDHPVLKFIDQYSNRFDTYQLQVKRGEEFGRKSTATQPTSETVPIFSAEELVAFKLLPPSYFIKPELIQKEVGFYNQERIGVNLAFRHKLKAAYIGKVYSLKSIISIYNGSYSMLLEVLGWLNSTLFDWYHRQRYCTFTELRANQITEMKHVYPLKITGNLPLTHVVEYLMVQESPYFRQILENLIYDQYLFPHLFEKGLYSKNEPMLKTLLEKYCKKLNVKDWIDQYMEKISKPSNDSIAQTNFDLQTKNLEIHCQNIAHQIASDNEIATIIGKIHQDPWIQEIEVDIEN